MSFEKLKGEMIMSFEKWDDNLERWPAPLPAFELNPAETALIVIDMQNYFCDPNYGVSKVLQDNFPDMAEYFQKELNEKVIPNTKSLINLFREFNLRIIYMTVGPELKDGSDLIERKRNRDKARQRKIGASNLCYVGSYQHKIIDELEPLEGELVFNKNSSGAFSSTGFDQFLKNFGIKTLIVCGVATNVCVDLTSKDAADRGYNVLLVEDGCATYEKALQDATLRCFARVFGRVYEASKVIEELKANLPEQVRTSSMT